MLWLLCELRYKSNNEGVFWVRHPSFCLEKDRLCLIRWCVKFQQPNPFLKFNLSHLKKSLLIIRKGWEGQNKSVPYIYSKTLFKTFSLTLFETPILSGECWHNVTHGLNQVRGNWGVKAHLTTMITPQRGWGVSTKMITYYMNISV